MICTYRIFPYCFQTYPFLLGLFSNDAIHQGPLNVIADLHIHNYFYNPLFYLWIAFLKQGQSACSDTAKNSSSLPTPHSTALTRSKEPFGIKRPFWIALKAHFTTLAQARFRIELARCLLVASPSCLRFHTRNLNSLTWNFTQGL